MNKTRLEAFSDGVIAIVITIMVLELKAPHDSSLLAILELWPVAISYILSFLYCGIYWNNHHHTFHTVKRVTAGVLWANLHLLFWLSLVPFTTAWMGENHFAAVPVAVYGLNLLMTAVSYFILQGLIIKSQGVDSLLRKAVGKDWKGKASLGLYLIALSVALFLPAAACSLYALVALLWIVPDKRIERTLESTFSGP